VVGIALAVHDPSYSSSGPALRLAAGHRLLYAQPVDLRRALHAAARLKSDLERYAGRWRPSTGELGSSLAKLEAAGSSVVALARVLDQAASAASLSAEASAARSKRIGEETEKTTRGRASG
jgi:hypothetical protein